MVTKLGPPCKVKLLKDKGDTLVVCSPEKAGVGGSTPSLVTIFSIVLQISPKFHTCDFTPVVAYAPQANPCGLAG
jgi:hypothetical protein